LKPFVLKAIRPGTPALTTSSGEREVHLVKLDGAQYVSDPDKNGAVLVAGSPKGPKMGWMRLKRGHQGLLPKNTAYQFRATKPTVIVLQTSW
jgi:hypothetical protein